MIIEFAQEIIKAGINGYFVAGLQGIMLGVGYGIMGLILFDMCKNKENSIIIKKLRNKPCATENVNTN